MANPLPGLPEFEYIRPTSLAEAARFLAEHPHEARPFLGGTDTFVRLRDRLWKDQYLVDVKRLEGMNRILFDPSSGLTLGGAVTMNQVIAAPEVRGAYSLLAEAARTVGSYHLRSRATVVGNVCNASPAGDTIGACLVYQGVLQVYGPSRERRIPLREFFLGPGKTSLRPGEIVTSIHFPIPPSGYAGQYLKLGRNEMSDLAIVGVTVLGYPDGTAASGMRFRLALASVAPVPLVPEKAELILADRPWNADTIQEAAEAAMSACNPIDDVRASARYRRLMVRNLTRQALQDVWVQVESGNSQKV